MAAAATERPKLTASSLRRALLEVDGCASVVAVGWRARIEAERIVPNTVAFRHLKVVQRKYAPADYWELF